MRGFFDKFQRLSLEMKSVAIFQTYCLHRDVGAVEQLLQDVGSPGNISLASLQQILTQRKLAAGSAGGSPVTLPDVEITALIEAKLASLEPPAMNRMTMGT